MIYEPKGWINGDWVSAVNKKTFPVLNPANSEVIEYVSDLGSYECLSAITSAHKAFPRWSALTAGERSDALNSWFEIINSNSKPLSELMTSEMGKPINESLSEVKYGASFIQWFAEEAKRIYGEIIPPKQKNQRLLVSRRPVGVVGAITPWNFPLAMITRKVAPALAAGCTVVIKPSEDAPLTALALAFLSKEAGIPDGVINIVPGLDAHSIGTALTSDPRVKKITFTGSTAVGKKLYEQSASTVKKISLELGGNAPFIVFDDAELSEAVEGLVQCKFRNAGQTCVCANRIFVQDTIYEDFVSALIKRVSSLVVGSGSNPKSEIGPLINKNGLKKVETHLSDAIANGAKIRCGGGIHDLGGLFFSPTVLTEVSSNMIISQEETFGLKEI